MISMKVKGKLIKILLVTSRVLFGATFIFSGFVKAIDPIGFAYKIEDYLISFDLTQFIPLALTFAVVLILFEFLLGVFILLGIYRKVSTPIAILFMVVMTPMTLYIALKNPVEDCGCFGDALVIDNWTTFYKNIVLITLAIFLFVYRRYITPFFSNKTKNYVLGFVFLFSLLFCLYNILYLPVMDFRPYKVGVNIPDQMEDDLSKGDVYESIYIYEKDGVQKEYTEDNYPWEDSTWTFVDLKSKLIKEGVKPLIEGFSIIAYDKDSTGTFVTASDITDEVLSKPFSLLVVSLSLDKANKRGMQQIIAIADYAKENDIDFRIATSTEANTIEQWNQKWGNDTINYASMDELTLKTIVRSNPGLLLLTEGTIRGKWSSRNLPNVKELNQIITKLQKGEKTSSNNNSLARLLILGIVFVIPLLGIKWYDVRANKIKQQKYNK